MSELNPDQHQDSEGKKPLKASLTELLRVDVPGGPTMLSSRPGEREDEPAPAKTEAAQPAAVEPETPTAEREATTIESATDADPEPEAAVRTARPASGPGTASAIRSGREERIAPASFLARSGWQALGLCIASVGVLVVPGHHFSPRIGELLGRLGDFRILAAALIVGGGLMFVAGTLRRMLHEIRGSLDAVSLETARLEAIAQDSHNLTETLKAVRSENAALTENVGRMQGRLKRLTDLVSSPDYTVSIFRLAASVDQLGKHVAAYMKEQFGIVQQRLLASAQQANHAEQQLSTALGQIQTLAKEQHKSHTLAMQEAFEELRDTSEQTTARIDQNLQAAARIEAQIQTQEDALNLGFTTMSKRSELGADQVASGLNELRVRLDRDVADRAAAMRATCEQLDKRIELAERAQTSDVKLLTDHVKSQLAGHVAELQQTMKSIAELANRSGQEIASEFDELGTRLDEHSRLQLSSLEAVGELTNEATGRAKSELGLKLEQIQAQLGQHTREALEGSREHLTSLEELREQTNEATRNAKAEISSRLEQLQASLGAQAREALEQAREQQTALQESLERSGEATRSARLEIGSKLEQVQASLGAQAHEALEQAREQQSALQESLERSGEATRSTKLEIGSKLEQVQASVVQQARDTLEQFRGQMTSLQELLGHSSEATRAAKLELSSKLEQIQVYLGQQSREHLTALHKTSQDTQHGNDAARRELVASLGQIQAHLEQQARNQLAALNKASQEVQQSTGATRRELALTLEQGASRIEKALETRSGELANEMLGIAEMLESVSTELRGCITESIRSITFSRPPQGDAVEALSPAPVLEVANAAVENEAAPAEAAPASLPVEPEFTTRHDAQRDLDAWAQDVDSDGSGYSDPTPS
ncbi:MAG TPA: hypothetical protein VK843_19555 [Planctomycetota bacterium]|nr:hypothetical protein [Planctomycetota bacterium]